MDDGEPVGAYFCHKIRSTDIFVGREGCCYKCGIYYHICIVPSMVDPDIWDECDVYKGFGDIIVLIIHYIIVEHIEAALEKLHLKRGVMWEETMMHIKEQYGNMNTQMGKCIHVWGHKTRNTMSTCMN